MTAALAPRIAPRAGLAAPTRPAPRRTPGSTTRPLNRRPDISWPTGTRCSGTDGMRAREARQMAVYRRRRGAASVLVGAALAGLVWFFAVVGGNYEASVAPAPTSTSVVHVRAGESLSAVAARVAPELPTQAVINKIVELNHLESSGVRVGQALVTPVY
ncbi:LysM peptidoglycan-binding domain-containing protein [Gordonia sp. CPCC 205333]|uniref:LysM peptidoglycan-binding domain-containing protein n=1 Tax=Gordonia sp. CPCC 205333 TaxID=3140790 RepID=UPI003AF338C0